MILDKVLPINQEDWEEGITEEPEEPIEPEEPKKTDEEEDSEDEFE